MDDFEKELKVGFLAEAKQAATDVEQCFLDLESNPEDVENLNKIFRLAHNLKGSSKAVGFNELGEFTHEFESFILKIKNKEIAPSAEVINLLLQANDHVALILEALSEDLEATVESNGLMDQMKNYSPGGNQVTAAPVVEELETLTEVPAVEERANLPDSELSVQEYEQAALEFNTLPEVPSPMATAPLPEFVTEAPAEKKAKSPAAVVDDTLRVSLQKVESLINFVGEMVILQSGLKEQAMVLDSPVLKRIVQHLNKVSKEIQETSMGLRMVPIKPVFQKMQRIVRDTSQALQKDVGIQLIGEETDIDKTILEKISDPLVHLVRNSVDHGIEDAGLRKSTHKPEKGQVQLKAYHQSGKLIIEVTDDGKGLDAEKLKKKAIEKGILASEARLTEAEAFNLIFAPGFSTKEQVTDVSGRGVGMDVVKTNIHELGGEVQIASELGKGSTFRIILPLTLAIVDAMILSYSGEKFVIPVNQVYETVKPDLTNIRHSALGDLLLLREENLPLYRLGDFFGIENSNSATSMIAVVVRTGPKPFAFMVDDILGQSQVVVKQLGAELQGILGISGSTILSDGKPALILEASDLLKRPRSNSSKIHKDPPTKRVNA